VGFIAVLTGFLLQWPTLLTVAMYPVLVYIYMRLARREEDDARKAHGAEFDAYAARVPRWLPKRRRDASPA
jgi:protein-S-isoprenylcysteine O-methyltransferase Ste14